ncbi:glycosyltransferase family 2 protein [soil metagenome]
MLKPLKSRALGVKRISRPLYQSWQRRKDLHLVVDNTARIRSRSILLFATLRNEALRIPFFLDYYRRLGVEHFIFVDNNSTDGFLDLVRQESDCSVWFTAASYRSSNFGMYWLNILLGKYGSGHWCLTCDPDEFLVYPYCEDRNLLELTEYLASEKRDHLFCLMLDMYGRGLVKDTHCIPGQNPVEVAPYFDRMGFLQTPNAFNGDMYIQGGARRRVMFADEPSRAPALNKTPLILWKPYYSYLSSMHVASPKRLNRPHSMKHICPTGCILHFKFLSVIAAKAAEEMERKEHYDNSVEYRRYNAFLQKEDEFYCEISSAYAGSKQLVELGLMNTGQWF